jgi:hypothetical protein
LWPAAIISLAVPSPISQNASGGRNFPQNRRERSNAILAEYDLHCNTLQNYLPLISLSDNVSRSDNGSLAS